MGGVFQKLLYKAGLEERQNFSINDSAVVGWKRSLSQLEIDCDVVFLGDSIISGGDWQSYFPEVSVVNLGIPGNSLLDMYNRLDMVEMVNPEKIFIMGGINGIKDNQTDLYINRYRQILDELKSSGYEIYIMSVLPLSEEKEKLYCSNATIIRFNGGLEEMAQEMDAVFINLYDEFLLENEMNPILTRDGIHLTEEGYRIWVDQIRDYVLGYK